MNITKDPNYNSKLQSLLKKLISEEQIAHDFYKGCLVATVKDEVMCFKRMFHSIAHDELHDHRKKLIIFAKENDYEVPFTYKEWEKYADPKAAKIFNSVKKNQNAAYYIKLAIKHEEAAVASYEEAMKVKDLPYEFCAILMQNYYDELDHITQLSTLLCAYENGAELNICQGEVL